MAKELLAKGSVKLSLDLGGENMTDNKSISASDEVTVQLRRTLQRPPVAPDAHHSNWYFGNTHSHSTYTWDYYFGGDVAVTASIWTGK